MLANKRLAFAIIATLVTAFLIVAGSVWYRDFQKKSLQAPGGTQADRFASDTFKPDFDLPYPLNLPAVSNVDISYRIDGRIESIKEDSDTNFLLVEIRAIEGPKFPDPVRIAKNQTVSKALQAGNSTFTEKNISQMKQGDRLIVTLSHSYKLKKTFVSILESL